MNLIPEKTKHMNETNIELIHTAELEPHPTNSKIHSPAKIEAVANAIEEFGFTAPVLIDENNVILAGHCRVTAAQTIDFPSVPCVRLTHLSETQKNAYVIADNRLAEFGSEWDESMLAAELAKLETEGFDIDLLGFDEEEINRLTADLKPPERDEDDVPEVPAVPVTVLGDVWILGNHRVMCGDSTSAEEVEELMGDGVADLVHADPPYGMGKEADGVINDNIYGDKLDAFQMEWWKAFRPFISNKAGAYIWGNAPDLWRLWYNGGLAASELMEFKNHITWDKKAIPGMKSPLLNCFPIASEHCLFFMIGDQMNGNVNTDGYFDGWDAVRLYLKGEADSSGINAKKLTDLCGCGMYSHWFSKSQWSFIPEVHYNTLAVAFSGCFEKPWAELKKEHDHAQSDYREHVNEQRGYFDNAHETMRDTWEFSRVSGAERFEHATPKPVAMMVRVMMTSLPEGGLCVEPFGGSGSTLMGAEVSGRHCNTMELDPKYCDVIVQRWQDYTGQEATHAVTGETFNETANG